MLQYLTHTIEKLFLIIILYIFDIEIHMFVQYILFSSYISIKYFLIVYRYKKNTYLKIINVIILVNNFFCKKNKLIFSINNMCIIIINYILNFILVQKCLI